MILGSNLWEICPYLFVRSIDRVTINTFDIKIVDFVISSINRNCYCYLYVKTDEIEAYKNRKGSHDLFIYGYDLQDEIFYCADYFESNYEKAKIPFEQVKKGYANFNEHPLPAFDGILTITNDLPIYYQKRLQQYETYFSEQNYIRIIIELINEYLHYRWNDKYMFDSKEFVYGIDLYDTYIEYFKSCDYFDRDIVNSLCLFSDHKKIIHELCLYFDLSNNTKGIWSNIKTQLITLILKYIKWGFDSKISIKNEIISSLLELKTMDMRAMLLTLKELQDKVR